MSALLSKIRELRGSVADLGVRWIRARDERLCLEKARNEILCVNERMEFEPGTTAGGGWMYRSGDACWKGRFERCDESSAVWVTNREPDEWCENCKRRAEIHAQYVRARNRSTSLRGALTRACVRAAAVNHLDEIEKALEEHHG